MPWKRAVFRAPSPLRIPELLGPGALRPSFARVLGVRLELVSDSQVALVAVLVHETLLDGPRYAASGFVGMRAGQPELAERGELGELGEIGVEADRARCREGRACGLRAYR